MGSTVPEKLSLSNPEKLYLGQTFKGEEHRTTLKITGCGQAAYFPISDHTSNLIWFSLCWKFLITYSPVMCFTAHSLYGWLSRLLPCVNHGVGKLGIFFLIGWLHVNIIAYLKQGAAFCILISTCTCAEAPIQSTIPFWELCEPSAKHCDFICSHINVLLHQKPIPFLPNLTPFPAHLWILPWGRWILRSNILEGKCWPCYCAWCSCGISARVHPTPLSPPPKG